MATNLELYSTDPADLFSQLYDELPERLFAQDEEAEAWLDDSAVAEIAADIEHQVVLTGEVDRELVARFLDVTEENRNRFAVLLGLDRAFLQADLVTGTHDSAGLTELTLRYLETGRLSTDAVAGAVLPKVAVPAQDHLLPETLREAFSAVIRVGPETPLDTVQILLEAWPSRSVRESGIVVAALPAFDRSTEFEVERMEAPTPSYRLRIGEVADDRSWVTARLAALDASGASVGLLPELALTPGLLTAWQAACRTTRIPQGGQLRWIVVGSGPETDDRELRPHNRAVVLDRATGDVVWEQDKQYRFQLEQTHLDRWGLNELGNGPVEEWITVGKHTVIAEAPGFRPSVIVCEDLTQLDTVGATIKDWGVSHALCPIFSQAIRRYRWEQQHGAWLLAHAGVQLIVCNSQWVGDVEPDLEEPSGYVLAISSDARIEPGAGPLDAIAVRFTEHGVFVR